MQEENLEPLLKSYNIMCLTIFKWTQLKVTSALLHSQMIFSIKLQTYLIKKKNNVIHLFVKFKSIVERQICHKIRLLRTDGGGEYVSSEFDALCEREGIVHKIVPPYTSQQNGSAKRKNMTIMNMVRSMSKGKHLPNELWGKSVSIATYFQKGF